MRITRKLGVALAAAGAAGAVAAVAVAAGTTGPSSSATPYLVPTAPGVEFTSILTVGDSVNTEPDGVTPYRMVGIPDGLGAFRNRDGRTFTVLMNHEITGTAGVARAHGGAGAFVSRWTVDRKSLKVLGGEDLIKRVYLWDATAGYVETPNVSFSRFCSSDLGPEDVYLNRQTRRGYPGRILLNGEESGPEGRAFAHLMNGDTYQLPALGRFSWENAVVQPGTGDRTVVVGTDDGLNGQVYVYVGTKQRTGTPVERAGLTNGRLYGVRVAGLTDETNTSVIAPGTPFGLIDLGDVTDLTGAELDAASEVAGVTSFQRPEDASFNPERRKQLILATTASFTGNSRLWSLRFSGADPLAGGALEVLTDTATSGMRMADNLTVGEDGEVIVQEDIGNQTPLGKIWRYSLRDRSMTAIAEHDPARFTPGAPGFVTQDEESSGVIPAPFLGDGMYLLDVQAHTPLAGELVEPGQLLAMRVREAGGR